MPHDLAGRMAVVTGGAGDWPIVRSRRTDAGPPPRAKAWRPRRPALAPDAPACFMGAAQPCREGTRWPPRHAGTA